MSATHDSAYEAQKALIDFYNNLPDEYKYITKVLPDREQYKDKGEGLRKWNNI